MAPHLSKVLILAAHFLSLKRTLHVGYIKSTAIPDNYMDRVVRKLRAFLLICFGDVCQMKIYSINI